MAKEKKNKEKIVPIRMDEDFAEKAMNLAASRGISFAGLVRMLLIKEIEEEAKGK